MLCIQENVDLLPYNTFHVSCIARYFCVLTTPDDIHDLIHHELRQKTDRKLFLGGGSNILFIHDTFDGLVIKNEILGKEIIAETETHVTLRIGAGEHRDDFVWRTLQQGYRGLENLVSIPGTVGAAPIQNIGAYGIEVEKCITLVHCIDTTTGETHVIQHDACQFGYRDSVFKHNEGKNRFVIAVTFMLPKYTPETYVPVLTYAGILEKLKEHSTRHPEASLNGISSSEGSNLNFDPSPETPEHQFTPLVLAEIIADIRREKLPDRHELGTAGSFFKNPIVSETHYQHLKEAFPDLVGRPVANTSLVKLSAGQLIEKAGFKGYRHGNVGVYEKHALVLVNYGGGSGRELMELILEIQEAVDDIFSVMLFPEVHHI